MIVYVQDKTGRPLMPTQRLGKVRHWLREGRAEVVYYTPFTIRLVNAEGGYVQPLSCGVDVGTEHLGVAVVSEKEELFEAEIELRTDMSGLLSERRMFRRSRRARKTPYRAARYLHRIKQDELAPSVRGKVNETLKVIDLIYTILPISQLVLELGNFDPHRLKNPAVSGVGYQQGEQYGYANAREYVLWRDGHTCQACKGKSGDPHLETHHIHERSQGGSDRVENLITLCHTCHEGHHQLTPLPFKKPASYRDATQFNVLKSYLKRETAARQPIITFGYITKVNRYALGLPKSHRNDAFVIAGSTSQQRTDNVYFGKFFRRQNRKLHKGAHSHIRNTLASAFGFKRGDKVRLADGRVGFIYGLRSSGYFDVRRLDGTVLHKSAKHSTLRRLESACTFRLEPFTTLQNGVAHSSPV